MKTATLDAELTAIVERWRTADRREQDIIYAKEFAPGFVPLFAQLPLAGAPESLGRPKGLVSVLGLSWQPAALMSAWAHPERLLVLGTKESFAVEVAGRHVLELILQFSGLSAAMVEHRALESDDEAGIYREVRQFLDRHGYRPREVFIDPTGGKKSMSAAASLAGYLSGSPLVYVDYAQYQERNRIPLAGSEFPRLLANPLDVFGDIEKGRVFDAFDSGHFDEAEIRATELAGHLYEPRPAETLARAAAGYGAWDAFRFRDALATLREVQALLSKHDPQDRWHEVQDIRELLPAHLQHLEAVCAGGDTPETWQAGRCVLLNHLAAARRALAWKRTSVAVLLLYATIERMLNLYLRAHFGMRMEQPDFTAVDALIDRAEYEKAGALLGESSAWPPHEGPLMFASGLRLLAGLRPGLLSDSDLKTLRDLGNVRNTCEFEHGFMPRPPDRKRVDDLAKRVTRILEHVDDAWGGEDELARLRFPRLVPGGAS